MYCKNSAGNILQSIYCITEIVFYQIWRDEPIINIIMQEKFSK
jgi:hypothetical protein